MKPEEFSEVLAALEALAVLPAERRHDEAERRLADRPELLSEVLASLPFLDEAEDESELSAGLRVSLDHSGLALGRYRLGPVVGFGGVGIVYEARDAELDRAVAVKVLHPSFALSPVARERFAREFRSAAALQHENIARVYDSGESQGLQYCVMELIHGAASLRDQRFTPRRAAEVVAAVCRGLQHSHAAGVVHRDVKPANILLTAEGTPKIVDFGLARDERFAVDRLTRTGELAGTIHYMSPEQVARRREPVTHATDIYSVGAVFYELLMHRPPHEGQTSVQVFESIREEPPRRIDRSIPVDLATICYKALRKQPSDRYASAAAMADDLDRFLRGDPILARPESPARTVLRVLRRPRVRVSIALLLVVAFSGWGVYQRLEVRRSERQRQEIFEDQDRRNRELIPILLKQFPDEYNPTGDPRFPKEDPDKKDD
ncbi:MAG: serine/threonine protein kinase [Planctomycetes bacterium]|nr:serine/threonine protein kinase [Planctomycetota bacterium]